MNGVMGNRPPAIDPHWALFLDFDGTLVEIADHPDEVRPAASLRQTLAAARDCVGGALAVVSGRSIDSLDGLLAPLVLPLAGVHGLERRDAQGRVHFPAQAVHRLEPVRQRLDAFVAAHPGVFYEDKHAALAVHYRAAPEHAGAVEAVLADEVRRLGADFELQSGKSVLEIKPRGSDKGTAVHAFMDEPPFAGRRPIFAGDDRTDEHAFAVVNALGGYSVRVGSGGPTEARFELGNVEETLAWLNRLPTQKV